MSRRFNLRTVLEATTSLVTALAALAVLWTVMWPRTTPPPSRGPARSSIITVDGVETSLSQANKTHDGAKVAIIEFSDFECPYCGRYARDIYPQVLKELVEKGIVNYSFRHFPLESIHKAAFKAGEAAACAGAQGRFWEMHERLFQNQKQLSESDLLAHARALALDDNKFKACLTEEMAARIREDQEEAKRFGVSSTPTFLVGLVQRNGKIKVFRKFSGAQPYESFKSVVDEVLKGA